MNLYTAGENWIESVFQGSASSGRSPLIIAWSLQSLLALICPSCVRLASWSTCNLTVNRKELFYLGWQLFNSCNFMLKNFFSRSAEEKSSNEITFCLGCQLDRPMKKVLIISLFVSAAKDIKLSIFCLER